MTDFKFENILKEDDCASIDKLASELHFEREHLMITAKMTVMKLLSTTALMVYREDVILEEEIIKKIIAAVAPHIQIDRIISIILGCADLDQLIKLSDLFDLYPQEKGEKEVSSAGEKEVSSAEEKEVSSAEEKEVSSAGEKEVSSAEEKLMQLYNLEVVPPDMLMMLLATNLRPCTEELIGVTYSAMQREILKTME